jgi:hypothetical protein
VAGKSAAKGRRAALHQTWKVREVARIRHHRISQIEETTFDQRVTTDERELQSAVTEWHRMFAYHYTPLYIKKNNDPAGLGTSIEVYPGNIHLTYS